MSLNRRLRRTDLFLVRIWAQEGPDEDECSRVEGEGAVKWQGRVQRVVDGEAYQFNGWQGLTDLLLAMVSGTVGKQPSNNIHNEAD